MLPKGENSRFLAVVLILIALLVGYLLLVHWWFTARHLEISAQMDELRQQEAEIRADAAQRKSLETKLTEIKKFEDANPAFLLKPADHEGEWNTNTASAWLVSRTRDIVNRNAKSPEICTIQNTTHVPAVEPERFERARINVRLKCDVEGFAKILFDLENASPVLLVENLNIWKQQTYRQPGQTGPASFLDIQFDVTGYLHQKPAEEKKS